MQVMQEGSLAKEHIGQILEDWGLGLASVVDFGIGERGVFSFLCDGLFGSGLTLEELSLFVAAV